MRLFISFPAEAEQARSAANVAFIFCRFSRASARNAFICAVCAPVLRAFWLPSGGPRLLRINFENAIIKLTYVSRYPIF